MLPNREGRFKARIVEHGLDETGKSKLATFVARFELDQELVNGQWEPVDESFDITGYFYLEKKDGSINTITVDQLKSALGWSGQDLLWLQDADFSDTPVQIKLEYETYDGKDRLKVRYIDAADATPSGVPKASDETRRSLAGRLGAKLRALSGAPVTTPKPTGTPKLPNRPSAVSAKAPARSAASPPTAPAPVPATAAVTMQEAWEHFANHCPEHLDDKAVTNEWFRVLSELVPGKEPQAITPAEWAKVKELGPSRLLPV